MPRLPLPGAVGLPRGEPKRITMVLDLFHGPRDQELSHATLRVMLNALFQADVLYLRAHPETPDLYDSGVVYQEEPPGAEDWQDIPTCLRLGYGDCEDEACWLAAELVVRYGIAAYPDFTCQTMPDGTFLYHIIVRLPDGVRIPDGYGGSMLTSGHVMDPSRQTGMV